MKTKAVRLYGKNDLRLEEFELPAIKDTEILAKIVSDSICMSSYKAAVQGPDHKRVPNDVAENPIIVGHEFCGEIVEVGAKWADQFKAGQKFSIQPALFDEKGPVGILSAPGYSYPHIGGNAQHIIIPEEVMRNNCLLPFNGEAFYLGSIAEPMSCVIGAFHSNYHVKPGTYVHEMEIVEGGATAILAGVGPMGLGAIDYAIHREHKPSVLVVTDINTARLKRAADLFSVEEAKANGVDLHYVNTAEEGKDVAYLKSLTKDGAGFNDVFVYAPVAPLIAQGDEMLAVDGCLNFFAGPSIPDFKGTLNFYNVHYASTHICGTSGGNTDDMIESLRRMESGNVNPSTMITHVGGLDSAVETTLNLPEIPGGKKLIYTGISFPLVAIDSLAEQSCATCQGLAEIIARHNGLWNPEAERYLLANTSTI